MSSSSSSLPTSDTTTKAKGDSKDFWVNMPNLISHLKKVADQKPQATYYNVDMLKYQVNSLHLSFHLELRAAAHRGPAVRRCRPTASSRSL